MNKPKLTPSGNRITETMIGLARCSRFHRIIVAGSSGPERTFELHRRGYSRVMTTTTCGLPHGQYDVAFVDWQLHSMEALETTLDWLVHFLAPQGVLVVCVDAAERLGRRKLNLILQRLGFRVEAGTRCEQGLAISARRLDASQQALAA
jgi:hypothetical protein